MRTKTIFLLVVIAVSVLLSFTYGQYYTLASADFISQDLKLETFDQEFLIAAYAGRLKIFGPNNLSIASTLCIDSVEQILLFTLPTSPSNQKTSILRC